MNLSLLAHFARAHWTFTHLRGEKLTAYQNRRARNLIRFVAANSPFHRGHWQSHDLADWSTLPAIDKLQMMADFGAFNTVGVSHEDALHVALDAEESRDFAPTLGGGLTVGLSSGTSGHRGLFLVSPAETAAWAGTMLARALHSIPPRSYRIALFLRANSNLYERLGASRRVVFRWFDLMTPIKEAVARLNDYAPDLLVGPPSLLRLLAEEKRHGALHIRPGRLLSVAEVLEPQDKAFLESAWDAPVGQIYQATEGLLAVTCAHGRLHAQEDLIAFQYEPADKTDPLRVTPVITDLWRRTQPIIRYRLNDVLRLAPADAAACPCGSAFRVIDAVEGRHDDVCWFPAQEGNALVPVFPDAIRRLILLADARITDYAAVQERPGHLCVYLAAAADAPFAEIVAAVRERAFATLSGYRCRLPTLEIEQDLPNTPAGTKRRRVVVHRSVEDRSRLGNGYG